MKTLEARCSQRDAPSRHSGPQLCCSFNDSSQFCYILLLQSLALDVEGTFLALKGSFYALTDCQANASKGSLTSMHCCTLDLGLSLPCHAMPCDALHGMSKTYNSSTMHCMPRMGLELSSLSPKEPSSSLTMTWDRNRLDALIRIDI